MGFFRIVAPLNLPLSMAGVTLGDRLVVVGCGDPTLVAELALKTGLTGRACAVDASEARRAKADAAIAREGALVDTVTAPWTALPYDDAAFDVAVIRNVLPTVAAAERSECLREVLRILRPGGRCLVIDGTASGLAEWLGRSGGRGEPGYDAVVALGSAGFRAVRSLARRGGLAFAEGVRANVEC